jgi:hypothetical protein
MPRQLSFGARPDSRDINFRTPVQFSLPHAKALWLCEAVLRLHRWKELKASLTLYYTVFAYPAV